MSGSDTHADTIRAALHVLYSFTSDAANPPGDGRSATWDKGKASLDALVAERDRERARADQAEAALRQAEGMLSLVRYRGDVSNWGRLAMPSRKEVDVVITEARAALSAGSGVREPRPEGHEGMVTVYDHNGGYLGCMGRETWEKAVADEAERRRTTP